MTKALGSAVVLTPKDTSVQFSGSCALGGGQYLAAYPASDGTMDFWLITAGGIADHVSVAIPGHPNIITGPMLAAPGFVVVPVQVGTNQDVIVIGLSVGTGTLAVAYTTDTGATVTSYPGNGWIDGGRLCIANNDGPTLGSTPATQAVFDTATGTFLGTGPYAPRRTAQLAAYLFDVETGGGSWPEGIYVTVDVPGVGPADALNAAPDLFTETTYQPIGNGVSSLGSNASTRTGCVSTSGGTGLLVSYCYDNDSVIACIVGSATPPLRQRQRSDGLAASGAPRQHQRSTLQTSNRQRAVR